MMYGMYFLICYFDIILNPLAAMNFASNVIVYGYQRLAHKAGQKGVISQHPLVSGSGKFSNCHTKYTADVKKMIIATHLTGAHFLQVCMCAKRRHISACASAQSDQIFAGHSANSQEPKASSSGQRRL